MANTMSYYRSELVGEIDRIKGVKYRLLANCENIGMEVLSDILDDIISDLEKTREKMSQAEF